MLNLILHDLSFHGISYRLNLICEDLFTDREFSKFWCNLCPKEIGKARLSVGFRVNNK
uniref:Uncharacterized protein n=1 Tax=Tetranychus urticae TaxID=32264 RepID=T1JWT2_TETUR